jgi:hypothetical protein
MTVVLSKSSVLKFFAALVLAALFGFQSVALYQQNQWLHGEVGKTKEGTSVTRAMLVDALIQQKFVAPASEVAPQVPEGAGVK